MLWKQPPPCVHTAHGAANSCFDPLSSHSPAASKAESPPLQLTKPLPSLTRALSSFNGGALEQMYCYQLTTGRVFKKTAACWIRPSSCMPPCPQEGREQADAHRAAPNSAALPEQGAAPSQPAPQPSTRRGLQEAAPPCLCFGERPDIWLHLSCEASTKAGYLSLKLPSCCCFLPFSLGLLQKLRTDTRQAWEPLTPLQLLTIFTLYRIEMTNELAQNLRHR